MLTAASVNSLRYATYIDVARSKFVIAETLIKIQQYITSGQEDCLVQLTTLDNYTNKDITCIHQDRTVNLDNSDSKKSIDISRLNDSSTTYTATAATNATTITLSTKPLYLNPGSKVYLKQIIL